ncbi:MAG: hypothetical protein HUK22_00340 [Thermoguttaceae bacterium]|nr:hypothetical protein [Thermoguttaceae bacterium]
MNKSFLTLLSVVAVLAASAFSAASAQEVAKPGYAIVATPAVLDDAEWVKVVDSLKERRSAEYEVSVVRWDDAAFDELARIFPKYVAFVVKPEEATIESLATIWQKTRALDDDPYGDVVWGIITGYDVETAIRLTKTEDMVVENALGATAIALKYFKNGVCYDEGAKNTHVVKKDGGEIVDLHDAPDDTTKAIADDLSNAQLFITSGHASEANWSIGYSYKNGFWTSKAGELYGLPSTGSKDLFKFTATGSKIHIASGNCLIGHINGKDAMALALMRSANVDMMIGYVVTTWFGYMGWGVQDYYIEQPGRFTVSEAFFANNQALLDLILNDDTLSAQMKAGLEHDRDVVAIYGDPAWKNALAVQDSGWKQELTSEPGENGRTIWTLSITPLDGENTFGLNKPNGSQRGGRPFFQFFPTRVEDPQIIEGGDLNPIVTDNFIMIRRSEKSTSGEPFVVKISVK